ncbi:MAG: hypothetical protein IJT94_05770 [Oscillibacter sp.]|nr:hypothetical protein [Oscillibacter sp.]
MRVEANRAELLAAAQNAARIASSVSPLEMFKCASLETENDRLVIAATNGEMSFERRIPVNIAEDGQTMVNAHLLVEMVRRMGGDTVTVSHDPDGRVCFKSGETEYRFPVMNDVQYPRTEIPFPEDTVSVTGIPALVKRAAFAVPATEKAAGTATMKCVRLTFRSDGLRAVSTDGYRIASAKGESKSAADAQLLVPAHSLERLAQLVTNADELKVGITGTSVVFMKEDMVFSTRMVEGRFAEVDKVLAALRPTFMILTDAEALRNVVASSCVVMGTQNRFKLTFHGSRLESHCQSENGTSGLGLDVTALSGTPGGDFWFHPRLLLDCLRALSGTLKLGIVSNGALVMQTENLTCVQVAMREPASNAARCPEAKPAASGAEETVKPTADKPKTAKPKTRKKAKTGEMPGTEKETNETPAGKEAA